MPTNKPRVYVTFDPEVYKKLLRISKKENMNMSALIGKVVREWIDTFHLKETEITNKHKKS